MSAIAEIQRRIQGATALIAKHERAIALAPPDVPSPLAVNIRALEKMRQKLRLQFESLAKEQELEVYRYRLLTGEERATLSGVGSAWGRFQELFASVYGEVSKSKLPPKGKRKAALPPELGFAYAFEGSVGVVTTVPREPENLAFESNLTEATLMLFSLLEMPLTTDVARILGPKPIKALNALLEAHIEHRFGIGLEWRRKGKTAANIELTLSEVVTLQENISGTTTRSQKIVTGELVAVDTTINRFKILADEGDIIEGDIGVAIKTGQAAPVPARYTATITIDTKIITVNKDDKPVLTLEQITPIVSAETEEPKEEENIE